jgi:hypothetical protein
MSAILAYQTGLMVHYPSLLLRGEWKMKSGTDSSSNTRNAFISRTVALEVTFATRTEALQNMHKGHKSLYGTCEEYSFGIVPREGCVLLLIVFSISG